MLYDEIVKGINDQDDPTLRMTEECGNLGPKCSAWLQETPDPKDTDLNDTASTLVMIMSIHNDPLRKDGPGAEHLTEYCFSGSHDALPDYLSPQRNAEIMAKREQTEDKTMLTIKDKTMLTVADDEDFMSA